MKRFFIRIARDLQWLLRALFTVTPVTYLENEEREMTRNEKITDIANRLGIPPAWLDGLINFESGYDPLAKNKYSSARGLIQITNATSKWLFGVDSLTLVNTYPTFNEQMDNVVYPYLKRYAPHPSRQSLYMSVFYPDYRRVPPDTKFPDDIRAVNPNIVTVQDYMDFVDRRVGASKLAGKAAATGLVLLTVLGLWYFRGRLL